MIRDLLPKQRKSMIKSRGIPPRLSDLLKGRFPPCMPHLRGCNWTNYILSDMIGEILVRLEGFELSTPGSGDLQMRMINYMKFSESDTIAFPAVSMPSHSHLGNFRDANCARLCAQLFFFRPIEPFHACLRYQPCTAGLAELLTFFETRREPLLS